MQTKRKVILALLSVTLLSLPLAMLLPITSGSAVSCSITVSFEKGSNNAIQTALNTLASAQGAFGNTVCVKGGTFPEQLNITSYSLSLYGLGTSSNPTVISPSTVTPNTFDPDNNNAPVAAIIAVGNSTSSQLSGVTIHNVVLDGATASSSFNGCGTDYRGINYLDASGTVSNNTVRNIYLPSADAGCQDGQGIYVSTVSGSQVDAVVSSSMIHSGHFSPLSGHPVTGGQVETGAFVSLSSTLSVTKNNVLNYNKNGITCNDQGTTCTISSNVVSFYIAYQPDIAPNGIQIAFGAVGKVTKNSVSNNECLIPITCGPTGYLGSGILTYSSGSGTAISGNTLTYNDMGVASFNDSLTQSSNKISFATSNYGYGIFQESGTYTATSNTLTSCPYGIVVLAGGSFDAGTTTMGSITSTLKSNTFSSSTVLVQIDSYTPGVATVHFGGYTYHLSGNSVLNVTQP